MGANRIGMRETMPTDDVSALARLREKLAGMTPGRWFVGETEPRLPITNSQPWSGALPVNSDPGTTVVWTTRGGEEEANATGIVASVSIARFVADEENVERVARALYQQEVARSAGVSMALTALQGAPVKDHMEPFEDCAETTWLPDARAILDLIARASQ